MSELDELDSLNASPVKSDTVTSALQAQLNAQADMMELLKAEIERLRDVRPPKGRKPKTEE